MGTVIGILFNELPSVLPNFVVDVIQSQQPRVFSVCRLLTGGRSANATFARDVSDLGIPQDRVENRYSPPDYWEATKSNGGSVWESNPPGTRFRIPQRV